LKNLRYLRWGLAATAIACVFFYFLPVIPVSNLLPCGSGTLCLGNPAGLVSPSYALLHWGSIYFYEGGYFVPPMTVMMGGVPVSPALGWFAGFLFLPVACVVIGLMSPEMVDGSHYVSVVVSERILHRGTR
jgi:hypothetical protein